MLRCISVSKAINLQQFQDAYFADVVERCVGECVGYFGERLVAIYVWGSVHRGEAARGVSDLDMEVFVSRADQADWEWRNDQINDRLELEFPDLAWGLIPHPTAIADAPHNASPTDTQRQQLRNRWWADTLVLDATLVFGEEVTKGLALAPPDGSMARFVFEPVLMLARHAAGLEAANSTDFRLPSDPSRKLRKLARLAVLGGACLLMAQGRFQSYKGADVLPLLTAICPERAQFLDRTRSLYITPIATTPTEVDEYTTELVSWLQWVGEQLA